MRRENTTQAGGAPTCPPDPAGTSTRQTHIHGDLSVCSLIDKRIGRYAAFHLLVFTIILQSAGRSRACEAAGSVSENCHLTETEPSLEVGCSPVFYRRNVWHNLKQMLVPADVQMFRTHICESELGNEVKWRNHVEFTADTRQFVH